MTPVLPPSAPSLPARRPALTLREHAGRQAPSPACRLALRASDPSVVGTVWVHRHVSSAFLAEPRDVWVYLPPGYAPHGHQRYPVLYMHDGNNLFSAATAFAGQEWGLDETAEYLIGAGLLPPLIIVGVANTPDRTHEYTWVADAEGVGGGGPAYARFLTEELMPFIDGVYRTSRSRARTGVMGASLGGLISLYLGAYCGDRFGLVGAMSPSIWWAERAALRDLAGLRRDLRLWLDMGGREGEDPAEWQANLDDARALAETLLAAGHALPGRFYYLEREEAGHDEAAWGERIAWALLYLFARPAPRRR